MDILGFLSENAAVVAALAIGLEFLLRKIPKAKSLLKLLDEALDKTPGFKNNE